MKLKILLSVISVFILCGISAYAADYSALADFDRGNSFYQQGKFKEAISAYQKIIDAGLESAGIYYNIGNAYFKTGSVGMAILNYERAKRLSPGDADVSANLEYANSLIIDRSIQAVTPYFTSFLNTVYDNLNADNLCARLAVINIVAFLLLAINVFLPRRNNFIIFIAAMLLLIFTAGFFVLVNKALIINKRSQAIVIVPDADCKFAPLDNATAHFKLYEGSKIVILKSEGPWSKIKRFDAKIGWVKKDSYERI